MPSAEGVAAAKAAEGSISSGAVLDAHGFPMFEITVTLTEKVGLPNYSNVDIGPVTITQYFSFDGEDDAFKQADIRRQATATVAANVREMLAEIRGAVLEGIKAFAASGGYSV